MILPAARLWYEGQSKELEEVIQEAEPFRLTGYARCVFQGGGQNFIVLEHGAVKEVMEIGPNNRPTVKNLRDLWGKSKIKAGLVQFFEIPPEVEYYLSRLADRHQVVTDGRKVADLKALLLRLREDPGGKVVDILTAAGKGLLIIENRSVAACYLTENEGFTLRDFEAFRRLVAIISQHPHFQAFQSSLADERPGGTPWLPILLGGAEHAASMSYLKNRLVEKFGHYYGPGATLFREGEEGQDLYLIQSGRVTVYKEVAGRRKILAELGPGDFFGEMAIFNKAPRTATAEAVENSLLIRIGREELHTLLYNSYDFRINMVKKLSRRLKDTVDEMIRLWEDPRALYLEKVIFQILQSDQKWMEEGIPPGLLMREISHSSGMRFSEIDNVFRKLLESGKIDFVRGRVVLKEMANLP